MIHDTTPPNLTTGLPWLDTLLGFLLILGILAVIIYFLIVWLLGQWSK